MPIDITKNISSESSSILDAMNILDSGVYGIVLIVDNRGRLTGVLTDGDIRRALLSGASVSDSLSVHMNRDFISANEIDDRKSILALLSKSCRHVPILDSEGRPKDVVSLAEIWSIGVSAPYLGGNEMKYVADCIANGWISSQGKYVGQFEQMLADFCGVRHAISTSSGTGALHLALAALGVGRGDEVIVPNVTFGASANTVLACGATPVFIDIDPHNWTMDINALEAGLTEHTRAIMPVHLYGHPCQMNAIKAFAEEHSLFVVEDCAEALGATYVGQRVGSFGHTGCFSFFPNKIVTTGEGGAVVTDDDDLADRLRILRSHGMDPKRRYWHLVPGFNYRMTNLQAAVGVAQMERVDDFLEERRHIRARYEEQLSNLPGILFQKEEDWAESVCWLFTITIDKRKCNIDRSIVIEKLTRSGVDTRTVFPPLSIQPAFQGRPGHYPNSSIFSEQGLSLPTRNGFSDEEIDYVCDCIKSLFDGAEIHYDN